LIEADLEDGIISISISGDGDGRRRFLDVLRASFYGIHEGLQRIGAKEFVPLHEHPTVVVDYDRLVQLEKLGQDADFVDIDGTLTLISIRPLLDGVSYSTNRHPMPTIKVFYSYSHVDGELRNEFQKHLSILGRQGAIKEWHDREITAGEEWERKIDHNLERADLILLLVSADFLASDYCYEIEMTRGMNRHEAGEARVIPVILRSCEWHAAPFGKLKALPNDGKPVKSKHWHDMDEAFADVAKGIRKAVEELRAKREESS
jgi:internalin A